MIISSALTIEKFMIAFFVNKRRFTGVPATDFVDFALLPAFIMRCIFGYSDESGFLEEEKRRKKGKVYLFHKGFAGPWREKGREKRVMMPKEILGIDR